MMLTVEPPEKKSMFNHSGCAGKMQPFFREPPVGASPHFSGNCLDFKTPLC